MASQKDPLASYFNVWIRNGPKCQFATSFSSETGPGSGRIQYICLNQTDERTAQELNNGFDSCGDLKQAVVVIFPKVTSEEQLTELIKLLCTDDRWRHKVLPQDNNHPGALVQLEWKTKDDLWSSVMGLAPLLTMPVTRRAPYCALALWPGTSSRKKGSPTRVSFMDMPSEPESARKKLLAQTTESVQELLGEAPDKAPWREVAFCLHEKFRDSFAIAG